MHKETWIIVENVKISKLLALFDTLEESDKDIVILMSELLLERCKINIKKAFGTNIENYKQII